MIRFKLKKKTSERVKKHIRRVLEIQEECLLVVKKQVEIALSNEDFSMTLQNWREQMAISGAIEEKNKAWDALQDVLTSYLLDFHGMIRDAISYYGEKNESVENGMIQEVIRETYDMMLAHFYDNRGLKMENYGIQPLKDNIWGQADGLHHFYCDIIVNKGTAEFQWLKIKENLKPTEKQFAELLKAFAQKEVGHWQLVEKEKVLGIELYKTGSQIPNLESYQCACTPKPLLKPQPYLLEGFREMAQIMLDNPTMKQTALKEKAAAENIFGYNKSGRSRTMAVALYKRLKTLHPEILKMIPELCHRDLVMLNVITRLRMDYLFFAFTNTTYLNTASMKMVDTVSRMMAQNSKKNTEPMLSMFELVSKSFFGRIDKALAEDQEKHLEDYITFLEAAELIRRNKFGQLVTVAQEITPFLMQALLDHGYGGYLRVIMGCYKYEPYITKNRMSEAFDRLWEDIMRPGPM